MSDMTDHCSVVELGFFQTTSRSPATLIGKGKSVGSKDLLTMGSHAPFFNMFADNRDDDVEVDDNIEDDWDTYDDSVIMAMKVCDSNDIVVLSLKNVE